MKKFIFLILFLSGCSTIEKSPIDDPAIKTNFFILLNGKSHESKANSWKIDALDKGYSLINGNQTLFFNDNDVIEIIRA